MKLDNHTCPPCQLMADRASHQQAETFVVDTCKSWDVQWQGTQSVSCHIQ